MYKFEKTEYGFKMYGSGFFSDKELENWGIDTIKILNEMPGQFNVLLDMRGFKVGPLRHQQKGIEIINICKQHGMKRSAVIYDSKITYFQLRTLAKEANHPFERYFNAAEDLDCELNAFNWLTGVNSKS